MADDRHLVCLDRGRDAWKQWRQENPDLQPDLSGARLDHRDFSGFNLRGADLSGAWLKGASLSNCNLMKVKATGAQMAGANLSRCSLADASLVSANLAQADLRDSNLTGANLTDAMLPEADLTHANLTGAQLVGAGLTRAILARADLTGADLTGAYLGEANLSEAVLEGAKLRGATLERALLLQTNLKQADLTGSLIYGVSVWNVTLDDAVQLDLSLTPQSQMKVTVDNLEMAQFLYLLMNYQKVGEFLGTVGRRGVLLLGRFTPERKVILDGLRDRLRAGGYLPILFDFDRPPGRNFTETVVTLAGLCRFIIADITNPSSAPLELGTIVPHFAIPLVPIINEGEKPFSMFSDLAGRYQWVLPLRSYRSSEELMAKLDQEIIRPALALAEELEGGKGVPVVPRPL